MPWKTRSPMDLRAELMNRLAQGERLTDLCQEYGISRKTAYKFKERFERLGVKGLEDQSRAPKVIPHRTPPELAELFLAERRQHPSWGAKKIKAVLEERLGRRLPSASAVGGILAKNGLVQPRRRRRHYDAAPSGLRNAQSPNDVWCIDYKGQFRVGDGTYCYPLTMTDQVSRYLFTCEGMPAISDEQARDICEETFSKYGLPLAMRSDNGVPFASPTGLCGLTKLSA